jgi:hypothetical protein
MGLPVALPPTIGSCGGTKAAVRDLASLAQFIDDHLVEMISPHATTDKLFSPWENTVLSSALMAHCGIFTT